MMPASAPPTVQELVGRYSRPATLGNPLRDLNPICLAVIGGALCVLAATLPGIAGPAAVCAAVVAASAAAGVWRTFLPSYAKLFGIVGFLLFALRALFLTGTTVIVAFGPFSISVESVLEGLRFALLVMAMCGVLTLFFAVVPPKHLMLALEAVGVTPKATYMVLASFQAIVDLGANTRTVMDAQKARGIETEGSLVRRAGAFVPVLTPVFLAALSQTEERALALDARAFNAATRHTHLVTLPRVSAAQVAAVVAAVAAAVFSIIGGALLWHS